MPASYGASRGAERVYAVDEVPEHLDQCHLVSRAFDLGNVAPVCDPLYRLEGHVESGSLDLVLVAGVLYHLSAMLMGLHALRRLLKPGGALLIESAAIDDFERSYADFARFVGGAWRAPSGLCNQGHARFHELRRPHDPPARTCRAATDPPAPRVGDDDRVRVRRRSPPEAVLNGYLSQVAAFPRT